MCDLWKILDSGRVQRTARARSNHLFLAVPRPAVPTNTFELVFDGSFRPPSTAGAGIVLKGANNTTICTLACPLVAFDALRAEVSAATLGCLLLSTFKPGYVYIQGDNQTAISGLSFAPTSKDVFV